ncbi:hypothetical protein F441_15129 [Phytophthora nicotianae CJ01A1]|uniref:Uncharacterized protein n=1 Tax=Phytophthora nicotianae CJ01A1 TaxID=1317063 RepID=W2WHA8_PHYNI|nr:hypothetical protein F441_15129 [Phytophthora nicotianae CJ01A1]
MLSESFQVSPFQFTDNLSNGMKDHYQVLAAGGLYAAGLPFRAFEVLRLLKALCILQPAMEEYLPTRKALSGRLLTAEYNREMEAVCSRLLDEPTVALVSDG